MSLEKEQTRIYGNMQLEHSQNIAIGELSPIFVPYTKHTTLSTPIHPSTFIHPSPPGAPLGGYGGAQRPHCGICGSNNGNLLSGICKCTNRSFHLQCIQTNINGVTYCPFCREDYIVIIPENNNKKIFSIIMFLLGIAMLLIGIESIVSAKQSQQKALDSYHIAICNKDPYYNSTHIYDVNEDTHYTIAKPSPQKYANKKYICYYKEFQKTVTHFYDSKSLIALHHYSYNYLFFFIGALVFFAWGYRPS